MYQHCIPLCKQIYKKSGCCLFAFAARRPCRAFGQTVATSCCTFTVIALRARSTNQQNADTVCSKSGIKQGQPDGFYSSIQSKQRVVRSPHIGISPLPIHMGQPSPEVSLYCKPLLARSFTTCRLRYRVSAYCS